MSIIEPAFIWDKADITKTDARTMKPADVAQFQRAMGVTPSPAAQPTVVPYADTPPPPPEPAPEIHGPPAPLLHDLNSNPNPSMNPTDWTLVNANPFEWSDERELGAVAPEFETSDWRWVPDFKEGDLGEYLGWGPITVVSGKWQRTHSAPEAVYFNTVQDGDGGAEFEAWEVHNLRIVETQHYSGLVLGIPGPPGAPSLPVADTDSPDGFKAGLGTDFDRVFSISYDNYIYQGEGSQMVFDQPMDTYVLEQGEVAAIRNGVSS